VRVGSPDAERRQHAGEDDGLGPHNAAPQSALPVRMPLLAGYDNEPLTKSTRSPVQRQSHSGACARPGIDCVFCWRPALSAARPAQVAHGLRALGELERDRGHNSDLCRFADGVPSLLAWRRPS
jgi:hypothetical protein